MFTTLIPIEKVYNTFQLKICDLFVILTNELYQMKYSEYCYRPGQTVLSALRPWWVVGHCITMTYTDRAVWDEIASHRTRSEKYQNEICGWIKRNYILLMIVLECCYEWVWMMIGITVYKLTNFVYYPVTAHTLSLHGLFFI